MYHSFDVHFTSACDNKCTHCIDKCFAGFGITRPDVQAIIKTVVENCEGIDDILFLGGEPCLYLNELVECVSGIKEKTGVKIYVTTSVPKICFTQLDKFLELLELLDGINLSVQHYKEDKADEIRKTVSFYDRQRFYVSLPYKEKIRINLNLVKPYLCNKDEIIACLRHYDAMGFGSIKLSEIQHGKDSFVSFEDIFGMKLGSPYSSGCQCYLDMKKLLPGFQTPVLLRRSCFLCEDTLKASLIDGVKVICNLFGRPKNKYGIIYGNGTLLKEWV